MKSLVIGIALAVGTLVPQARSEPDLRALAQNPVSDMFRFSVDTNAYLGGGDGPGVVADLIPVLPIGIGDWHLVNRTLVPVAYVEGRMEGLPGIPRGENGPSAFGLGDINHTIFLSPDEPWGGVHWGLGPSFTFPTAVGAGGSERNEQLGSEKWSVGPSFVAVVQPASWTLGLHARHLWSFASTDSSRPDVRQLLLQPIVNYNLEGGWYLSSQPVVTANWNADGPWTLPVGAGVGRVFRIGGQGINARFEAYYNALTPDDGPDVTLNLTLELLFPK